ncbi:hypothetical protein [Shewanella xiamenensis]|uniref:hypothetical protein n=1 Tax=Shewanella xiamenensis TaxID=332186 RepID=UPI000C12A93D|nr:hypothetical protein [Shewanella xiamenensis]PHY60398.1 hypothetical protein CS023_20935 [Shewanella xiamenensis]
MEFEYIKVVEVTVINIRKCSFSKASRLFILNFLDESECGIVRRLKEDMITLVNAASSNGDVNAASSNGDVNAASSNGDVNTEFFDCINIRSLQEFDDAIYNIIGLVKVKESPLIHIQGHGDENKGIACIGGDFISWEHLKYSLEMIISASNGELTVVAATCFSFKLTSLVRNFAKMPYSFFYGYDGEVSLGDMEDDLIILYKNFIINKDDVNSLPLKIRFHSEYSNLPTVCAVLLFVFHPDKASELGLSKRSILKGVKDFNIPASKQRRIINDIVRSRELVFHVVEKVFHPTQRREYLIEDILNYLTKIK